MALFGKKDEQTPPPAPAVPDQPGRPTGKTEATPTRREAEAARRQRINPQLSPKEAKAKVRADNAAARQKEFAAQDASPAKQLLRDVVDSRFNILEFALPAMMVLLVATLMVDPRSVYFPVLTYLTWGFMALLILDLALLWRRFKKLAAERIPDASLKGLLNYAFNRAMSFRGMRMPKPRVKRGDAI